MTTSVEKSPNTGLTLGTRSWASYVNMVSASIEEARRVMKLGGLSQPGVAEHLQSSRATSPSLGDR